MKHHIDISKTRKKSLLYNLEIKCTEDCTYKTPFDHCQLKECIKKTGTPVNHSIKNIYTRES